MNILIIGHMRHGKTTVAEMLEDEYGLSSKDSSMACAEIFIYDELKDKYNYESFEECYEDRKQHRPEWFQMICDFNDPDKARLAKEIGLEVSCDLNYRSKLWDYKINDEKVDPDRVMSEIAVYCDYLFGNETDIQSFFKIDFRKKEYEYEQDDLAYYENLLLAVSKRFPHIKIIALSIRKSINANTNYMGGILYIRDSRLRFREQYKVCTDFLLDHVINRIKNFTKYK